MGPLWEVVDDSKIRQIWSCENDDCQLFEEPIECTSASMSDGGTPLCEECESELVYSHTEIQTN
jgi:hypothetical protein